jgi:6-phosphogluconolactonase/glucosamine-6-phosphate isomerase/deaminase
MDNVEQPHSFGRLVGLKLADHVEFEARMASPKRRPFACRFGDAVLAEIRDPGGDQWLDFGCAPLLGHGDQGHLASLAPRSAGSARDLVPNVSEADCGIGHDARYRKAHGSEPAPMAARLADD